MEKWVCNKCGGTGLVKCPAWVSELLCVLRKSMGLSETARKLGWSIATTRRRLDALEDLGMVARCVDDKGRSRSWERANQ